MKKQALIFSGAVLVLFAAHHFSDHGSVVYFSLLSFIFLFVAYFVFDEDYIFLGFSLGITAFSIAVKTLNVSLPAGISFFSYFIVLLGLCFFYRADWKKILTESAARCEASVSEVAAEKRLFHDKEGSLDLMARQLNEITTLYELAKELNDCLSFEKMIQVLKERIFGGLNFKKAVLLVFADESDPPTMVRRFTILVEGGVDDSKSRADLQPVEKRIILDVYQNKKPLMIQAKDELGESWIQESPVDFPVWIFPLVVQEKVIALFTVEGGKEDDHPKFQVVAAQLALQVKKIRLYDTVRELSIIDGLTRVFVRRHFLERFEEELRRSLRHGFQLGVLMLDIDDFKSYNDNHGHLVGDVTLKDVAQVIVGSVRRVDIVSRYGGEEFVIVLPETDRTGAMEVAERIRSAVAKKRFKAYDEETKVTVSIGVSSFPVDVEEPAPQNFKADYIIELLKKADQALYQAKEEGRNRVVAYEKTSS